ncbi:MULTISPECIES: DUF6660 family protein [Dyadobacter]|uniref:DUF6660 family protein n=1 Tax=Dyadobacter TaxID=120831 RepID=UPI0038D359D4
MKLSLIIFALYVTALSCFPCQDVPVRLASEISSLAAVSHEESNHKDVPGDFCSPFCICTCCATVNMPPIVLGFALSTPLPVSAEKTFEYKFSFSQINANLIWQPPRLV